VVLDGSRLIYEDVVIETFLGLGLETPEGQEKWSWSLA